MSIDNAAMSTGKPLNVKYGRGKKKEEQKIIDDGITWLRFKSAVSED